MHWIVLAVDLPQLHVFLHGSRHLTKLFHSHCRHLRFCLLLLSARFLCQVVLVPVVLGAALNQNFPKAVTRTAPFAPLVAVIAVVLIVASVMAQNAAAVTLAGPKLIGAIIALHSGMRIELIYS